LTRAWRTDQTCMATRRRAVLIHLSTGSLRESTRLQAQVTSPSLHFKAYAARAKTCARRTTAHLHPCCARHTSLRASDSPDKARHQLKPPKLRIPIPCHTSYNTISVESPSYTPLPGVMTALALRTSLILVVGFHAVCRCTISGVQADSGEVRIPGITMTARVDIFTKVVTSNPQSAEPKYPNQICDSHPDLTVTEQTTNVRLITPLRINTDTRQQTRSTEIQTHHFPRSSLHPSSSSPQTHPLPHI